MSLLVSPVSQGICPLCFPSFHPLFLPAAPGLHLRAFALPVSFFKQTSAPIPSFLQTLLSYMDILSPLLKTQLSSLSSLPPFFLLTPSIPLP